MEALRRKDADVRLSRTISRDGRKKSFVPLLTRQCYLRYVVIVIWILLSDNFIHNGDSRISSLVYYIIFIIIIMAVDSAQQ